MYLEPPNEGFAESPGYQVIPNDTAFTREILARAAMGGITGMSPVTGLGGFIAVSEATNPSTQEVRLTPSAQPSTSKSSKKMYDASPDQPAPAAQASTSSGKGTDWGSAITGVLNTGIRAYADVQKTKGSGGGGGGGGGKGGSKGKKSKKDKQPKAPKVSPSAWQSVSQPVGAAINTAEDYGKTLLHNKTVEYVAIGLGAFVLITLLTRAHQQQPLIVHE